MRPDLLNPFGVKFFINVIFLFLLFAYFCVLLIVYFAFLIFISIILYLLPFKLDNALDVMWDNYIDPNNSYKDIKSNNNYFYSKRKVIPQTIKDKVWNRDGGKCVKCGSQYHLEYDHIIPHSKGGANTYRNLQLLCEPCNRSKSNKIG